MNSKDTLTRFLFKEASIRGEVAHLDETFTTIIYQRPYPTKLKTLLGEALISCLLLVGSIKFDGDITLQFQGDSRLPLLLVQCNSKLEMRAYAKFQEGLLASEYEQAFLEGKMVITMNQVGKASVYQSIVPIHSMSMSDNLMNYFYQSEQITSRIWLAVADDRAAGMLLQLMPGHEGSLQREQFWEHAVILGETISETELLDLDPEVLLHRLYHETPYYLYDPRRVRFQCRCDLKKMRHVLTVLGEEDTQELLKERGQIDVTCDFCNQHFLFDAIDVAMLFHKGAGS